jgi:hypothetical protein
MADDEALPGGFATVVIQHLYSYYYLYGIAFLVIQLVIRPVIFSPLSKYPGPVSDWSKIPSSLQKPNS